MLSEASPSVIEYFALDFSTFQFAYYGNVTTDGVFSGNAIPLNMNFFNNHGWNSAFMTLPNGEKLFAYSNGIVRSPANGSSWTVTSSPFANLAGYPHLIRYDNDIIATYADSSANALMYIKSTDSGATWSSPVTIVDTPADSYRGEVRGTGFPPSNSYTAVAGYFDMVIGQSANNNVSFARIFYKDVTPPVVSVQSPTGTFDESAVLNLNFTVTDDIAVNNSACSYSINFGTPVTVPSCANMTFSSSVTGVNTLVVSAHDTTGNLGTGSIVFNIKSPVIPHGTPNLIYLVIPILGGVIVILSMLAHATGKLSLHDLITMAFIGILMMAIGGAIAVQFV
jgi:hypothetical protein